MKTEPISPTPAATSEPGGATRSPFAPTLAVPAAAVPEPTRAPRASAPAPAVARAGAARWTGPAPR